jgi:hypothetical protein
MGISARGVTKSEAARLSGVYRIELSELIARAAGH